jgi:hypothetical protein
MDEVNPMFCFMATLLPVDEPTALHHEWQTLLHRLEGWFETPLLSLGAGWLVVCSAEDAAGEVSEAQQVSYLQAEIRKLG